jgi:hypothetical protein
VRKVQINKGGFVGTIRLASLPRRACCRNTSRAGSLETRDIVLHRTVDSQPCCAIRLSFPAALYLFDL